ncbi:MAG: GspE/PulE family protein, partial [bacterium]|nr:GspE/PulE family protein [bacterium]
AKGEAWSMPTVSLVGKRIPADVLQLFPVETVATYQMIPWKKEGTVVSIALVDPGNSKALEAAEFAARESNLSVEYVVTSKESFEDALKQYASDREQISAALEVAAGEFALPSEAEAGGLEEVTRSAPVSKIVSVILKNAIEGGASDVHIEPQASESQVRYRVDGVLHISLKLPKYIHDAVVSRIKVLAHMKIDETRIPQDGRIRITANGKEYDLRISTMPLLEHEKVVIRILDTSRGAPPLEELGFGPRETKVLRSRITEPHGMILVCGPTGSGKTTTLFSLLQILNKEGVNISTLEDPVEYFIKGVSQAQIRPEIGFTFATGLRSILRQDPDIVMVGEIRDSETAALAVHAGLTGHLVLSTLHTNDAIGAVPRLVDMEVEPYLLASTITVILAQRLVRKLCEKCKTPLKLSKEVEDRLASELSAIPQDVFAAYKVSRERPYTFYHGVGCVYCGRTGYKGRTALGEAIDYTVSMRALVAERASEAVFKEELSKQGFLTMRQNGLLKTLAGVTTVEEVIAATKDDR